MLEQIKSKEIMSKYEARKKYDTKYFRMIITETIDGVDNDLGYVAYIADDRRELSKIPMDEFKGVKVAFMMGGQAEPYPTMGNITYYDTN